MNERSKSMAFAIMSVFFLIIGVTAISPGIQSIAEAFPEVSYSTILLVSTLPSLLIIPSSYIAGAVAGSRVKYRTLVIGGALLFVLGGVAPYYLNNFTVILVMRAIFGIGLGLVTPIGNALVLRIFDGHARANMLGAGNVVSTLGGILLKLMAGFLAAINWRYMFLTHLLGLVTLIAVIFFLKEPEKIEQGTSLKVKLPGTVFLYGTVMMLIFMALAPVLLGVSTIILGEGLGDASDSAIVLAMFTTGSMTASALFSKVYKISKKYTVVFALFLAAGGLVILCYAPNLFVLGLGTYVTGLGLGSFIPGMMMDVGAVCRPETFAVASGVVMSVGNVGGFIGPYYMSLVAFVFSNPSLRFAVSIGAIILVLQGIVLGLIKLKTPDVTTAELSDSVKAS